MRVVSWNLKKQGERTWDFLWTLDPDIALVQEAVLPDVIPTGYQVRWAEALPNSRWGSAILSRLEDELVVDWKDWTRGAMLVAHCSVPPFETVSIASIHARVMDDGVIRALRDTFDALRPYLRERFIVGGDLNTARSLADVDAYRAYGHGEFWDDLDALGFKDCNFVHHGVEKQSFWREGLRNRLQDDHILVDTETLGYLSRADVLDDTPELRELSDHFPVVAEFTLP
jgi:endonuclease/exonuclease/phosphatase family metal-dependent hydrolase